MSVPLSDRQGNTERGVSQAPDNRPWNRIASLLRPWYWGVSILISGPIVAGLAAMPILFVVNLVKGHFTPEVLIEPTLTSMPFAGIGSMIGFQIGHVVQLGTYVWAALGIFFPAIDQRKGLWIGAACFSAAGTAYVYPTWLKSPLFAAIGALGFAGGFILPRLLLPGLEPGSMVLWARRRKPCGSSETAPEQASFRSE